MSEFKSGICDCFAGGFANCLIAWCLPCILYGQNVEKLKDTSAPCGGDCFMSGLGYCCLLNLGCPCLVHMGARAAVRQKYGINGDGCSDCLCTTFCGCCAIAQEAHQLAQ